MVQERKDELRLVHLINWHTSQRTSHNYLMMIIASPSQSFAPHLNLKNSDCAEGPGVPHKDGRPVNGLAHEYLVTDDGKNHKLEGSEYVT